jgi:hypothetical protein
MIKKLLWLSIFFFGLYYFGNFTVNNTNVREYLHSKVTPEMLHKARLAIVDLYDSARAIYDKYEKNGTIGSVDENVKPGQTPSDTAQAVELVNKLPLREISVQDKQKLLKILETDSDSDRAHP